MDLDDYCPQYSVYRTETEARLADCDRSLMLDIISGGNPCAEVPVRAVSFDESRRRAIDDDVLRMLFGDDDE